MKRRERSHLYWYTSCVASSIGTSAGARFGSSQLIRDCFLLDGQNGQESASNAPPAHAEHRWFQKGTVLKLMSPNFCGAAPLRVGAPGLWC